MSKATEYAEACARVANAAPEDLAIVDEDDGETITTVRVNVNGRLAFQRPLPPLTTLGPAEALKLADWIYAMFGEDAS